MLQRQISFDRDDLEPGVEALEEPLKARKRRESQQGIQAKKKIAAGTRITEAFQASFGCISYTVTDGLYEETKF